ncbi:MAG: hypothetical protein C4524_07655 [Candidatus Zixiibacteriota bacterium]|nr:MAG: hypothetical protein C4524_07655 [candidate division Zixibacteria bacterium]
MNRDTFALLTPVLLLGLLLSLAGCGGPSVFLDRSFDFNYVERVAVIPFDNLSPSQTAGRQATLMFITELLATETFNVIEPGETARILAEVNPRSPGSLDRDQIRTLGQKLNAQALVFGTVSESSNLRNGGSTVPTVTMDLRMVETESGETIWAATHTEGRPGVLTSLFGVSGKSTSETMRSCVNEMLSTLIQ